MKNIVFFLIISQLCHAQTWVNSIEDAKKVAKATNQFIVIDFNATWCQPCKKMETEFWKNPQYKKTLDKFVLVSVDIDANRELASRYSVKSIPNVKLVDINGNIIHEVQGYISAQSVNREFEGFPENSENLYETLHFKNDKKPTDEEFLNLATSYQVLLQKSQNNSAKYQFLNLSNAFFNKCIKNTHNADFKETSELGKFLNLTFTGSEKKVIKNLDVSKISDKNRSFANYILANVYYEMGNKDEAEKNLIEIQKINDEQWIYAAKMLKEKFTK